MPAHEEQGWKTLHSHWQIWVKEMSPQVGEDLWNVDLTIREEICKEFYLYVDKVMIVTYARFTLKQSEELARYLYDAFLILYIVKEIW
jgi:hypothetical protein